MLLDDNKSGIWPDSIDELSKSRRPPDDNDAVTAAEAVDDGNDISLNFCTLLNFNHHQIVTEIVFPLSRCCDLHDFAQQHRMRETFLFIQRPRAREKRRRKEVVRNSRQQQPPRDFFFLLTIINRGEMRLTVRFVGFN
jgi:hypothetical protein